MIRAIFRRANFWRRWAAFWWRRTPRAGRDAYTFTSGNQTPLWCFETVFGDGDKGYGNPDGRGEGSGYGDGSYGEFPAINERADGDGRSGEAFGPAWFESGRYTREEINYYGDMDDMEPGTGTGAEDYGSGADTGAGDYELAYSDGEGYSRDDPACLAFADGLAGPLADPYQGLFT